MTEYIWGRRAVVEALRSAREVRRVLLAEGQRGPAFAEVQRLAAARGVPVATLPAARLQAISPHTQGIAAEVAAFAYTPFPTLVAAVAADPAALVLALDSVQDPQNLGALLRTAEAAGVTGVVLPERRAAGVTPAVVRASAGAVAHLQIARVVNLSRALVELKAVGAWVYGLAGDGPQLYTAADLRGRTVIVVGSEGTGLGRLVRAHCDAVLRLPMVGRTASLNAAIAGSIVLYEALRQRAGSTPLTGSGQGWPPNRDTAASGPPPA